MLFLLLIIHTICIAASQRLFSDQTYLNALVWEEMLTSLTSIHKKTWSVLIRRSIVLLLFHFRLKEAQQTVQKITAEKKVETKKTNANSLVRKHSDTQLCCWLHTRSYVNNSIACVHTNTINTKHMIRDWRPASIETHTHTLTHNTHTHTLTHTHTHTHTHKLSLSLTHTHTHTHSHTLTHTHTHTHTQTQTHTHSHTHKHRHTHTHSLTHSLTHSHTHTHTHTHSHIHTHTQRERQRHTHTHTHTHKHTHTHTHTKQNIELSVTCSAILRCSLQG